MNRNRRYKNKKYGQLTLLEYVRPGGGHIGAIWLAQCDCGNVLEVIASEVRRGKRKTCGSHGKGLGIQSGYQVVTTALPKGQRAAFAELVRRCLRNGEKVGVTVEQYMDIATKRCICCNIQPAIAQLADPRRGLTPDNLVPICRRCNSIRNGMSIVKFLDYIVRTAANINSRISGS